MAGHVSMFDLYRMAAGELNAYMNYSNSQQDTNLDSMANGRSKMDMAQGALHNTTEDEDYHYNKIKKTDVNNVVDGSRHWSTSTPIIAAKTVNAMYRYAGESDMKEYLCEFEESKHPRANDGKFSSGGGTSYLHGNQSIPIKSDVSDIDTGDWESSLTKLHDKYKEEALQGKDANDFRNPQDDMDLLDDDEIIGNVVAGYVGMFHNDELNAITSKYGGFVNNVPLEDGGIISRIDINDPRIKVESKSYKKVERLLDMSESPETVEDLKRWASDWGVSEKLVFKVFKEKFGDRYDDGEPHSFENIVGNEGGHGSGKSGHEPWMRESELGGAYLPCSRCMVYSPQVDGKCSICGSSP